MKRTKEAEEIIDFSNCEAVKIDSDVWAPLAHKGEKLIYSTRIIPKDGDMVVVKLKSGAQSFFRYVRETNRTISVLDLSMCKPRLRTIKKNEINSIHKLVARVF